MNGLVNYASDSESEPDEALAICTAIPPTSATAIPSTPRSNRLNKERVTSQESSTSSCEEETGDPSQDHERDTAIGIEDDCFVSAALKELQSFAASVDTTPDSPSTSPPPAFEASPVKEKYPAADTSTTDMELSALKTSTAGPVSPLLALTSEQQFIFDAFLHEIDAIPLTSKDQSHPPDRDLSTSPFPSHRYSKAGNDISADLLESSIDISSDAEWQQTQTAHTIYSRMHQLSILSSPTIDHKDMESRLIEFAIRILDWEQGGMKPAYFLGEERARFITQEERVRDDQNSDEDHDEVKNEEGDFSGAIPTYGGVVGDMLEHMRKVEQAAAPSGWSVVWDPHDGSYGFIHNNTGTLSVTHPPAEVIS